MTALLFLVAGRPLRSDVAQGRRMLAATAPTPQPQRGRPMAAMAGLLTSASTSAAYSLGDPRATLTPAKVRTAWRIVVAAGVLTAVLCALALCHPWLLDLFS